MNPTETVWKYRTKDGSKTGHVIGAGNIVDGILTVPAGQVVENANLERVTGESTQDKSQTAPAAPAASTTPQASQPSLAPAPVQPQTQQTTNQETI